MASKWHLIDEEWAAELVGLRMRVRGSFWNGCTEEEKRTFYGGIIKEYNHDKRRWLIEFDNDDDDQYMRYDAVLRYADEDAGTFHDFKLPAIPIPPPQDEVIHENERFVIGRVITLPNSASLCSHTRLTLSFIYRKGKRETRTRPCAITPWR